MICVLHASLSQSLAPPPFFPAARGSRRPGRQHGDHVVETLGDLGERRRAHTHQRGVRAHDALLVWQRGRVVERARVEVEDARGGERARRKGRPCAAPCGFSATRHTRRESDAHETSRATGGGAGWEGARAEAAHLLLDHVAQVALVRRPHRRERLAGLLPKVEDVRALGGVDSRGDGRRWWRGGCGHGLGDGRGRGDRHIEVRRRRVLREDLGVVRDELLLVVEGELLVGPRAPRLAAPRVLAVVRVAPLEHRLFGPLVGRVECGVHPGQRLSGALELWSKLPRGRCGFARLTGWVVGGHLPCHFWRGHGAGQEALQEGRGGCRVVRRGRPRGGRAGRAGRGPR
mmetsp:Transcript_28810/g.74258  ORF Transcript_28810/g.74258 Transcript_28810/m.74258 type:complete len:345 (-) Transcript_28810:645-1679(-)